MHFGLKKQFGSLATRLSAIVFASAFVYTDFAAGVSATNLVLDTRQASKGGQIKFEEFLDNLGSAKGQRFAIEDRIIWVDGRARYEVSDSLVPTNHSQLLQGSVTAVLEGIAKERPGLYWVTEGQLIWIRNRQFAAPSPLETHINSLAFAGPISGLGPKLHRFDRRIFNGYIFQEPEMIPRNRKIQIDVKDCTVMHALSAAVAKSRAMGVLLRFHEVSDPSNPSDPFYTWQVLKDIECQGVGSIKE